MLGKKHFTILLALILIGACTISAISATEDLLTYEGDDSNEIEAINSDGVMENPETLSSKDESALSQEQSENVLSAKDTPHITYKIDLKDSYEIESTKDGSVSYYIDPCKVTGYNAYNFYLVGFDKDNKIVYNSDLKSRAAKSDDAAKNYKSTIPKNSFLPGTYVLAAVNYDGNVMDFAVLKVKGTATITSSDYNSYYKSGKTMTAKVTDKSTGKPLKGIDVKVVFTKGKSTTTKTYTTDSNGQITITPPSAVGTYTVTMSSATPHVTAAAIKKTAKVNLAPVKVKAHKASEYKGFKIKLKATVKSQGKKVNEGTVKFKINGKTYNAKVKNGVATKKIKLNKVKKYAYAAKFTGSNYKASKAVKAKAILKKRTDTKIVAKNQKVYMNDAKIFTIKVLTKSGKKVKNGKLKIKGVGTVDVKNGKVKVVKYGLGIKHLKKINGRTEYYKKKVSKSFKLKYVPGDHKYKPTTKKLKITSVFKCPGCGKKGTHNHYAVGYYVVYKTRIVVS